MTAQRRTIPTDPLDAVIPPPPSHPPRPEKTAAKEPPPKRPTPTISGGRHAPLTVYLTLDEMEEFHKLLWAVRKAAGKRLSMSDYARLSMEALKPRLRAIAEAGKALTFDEIAKVVGAHVAE